MLATSCYCPENNLYYISHGFQFIKKKKLLVIILTLEMSIRFTRLPVRGRFGLFCNLSSTDQAGISKHKYTDEHELNKEST